MGDSLDAHESDRIGATRGRENKGHMATRKRGQNQTGFHRRACVQHMARNKDREGRRQATAAQFGQTQQRLSRGGLNQTSAVIALLLLRRRRRLLLIHAMLLLRGRAVLPHVLLPVLRVLGMTSVLLARRDSLHGKQ